MWSPELLNWIDRAIAQSSLERPDVGNYTIAIMVFKKKWHMDTDDNALEC